MAKAFYKPTVDNVIENFDEAHYFHELSNQHYEMEIRDGEYIQRRYQIAPDGKRINELEQSVDYIMGSGNHVRTYLYRNQAGEIYELPLAWYSQTQQWRMNPGYDKPDHEGFNRIIKHQCMFCHNAYPDLPSGHDYNGAPMLYPEHLPEGIGCQRCHGPGVRHIQVANDDESSLKDVRSKIVNPANLSPKLRDDVCLQCHLLPVANIPAVIRKFDRGFYSYRPGEPLEDYQVVVDYQEVEPGHDRFEINHHPYRLYQSKCYQSSPDKMSCMTCHDPHRKIPREQQTAYYQEKCLSCHAPSDCDVDRMATGIPDHISQYKESNDCVGCHMPQRRPEDVIHVIMTDHLIQRGPPDSHWLDPLVEMEPPEVLPPFPYSAVSIPPEPLRSLYMALMYKANSSEKHIEQLKELIEECSVTDATALLYLANNQKNHGKASEARETYLRILKNNPDYVPALFGLSQVYTSQGQFDRALLTLQQTLEISPNLPFVHYRLGGVLYSTGQKKKGIQHWIEALRLNPNDTNVLFDYATVLHWDNQLQAASDLFKKILAIQPVDEEVYLHLGVVLMDMDRAQEAIRYLQHADSLKTDHPKIQLGLSIALALDQQYEEAESLAHRVVQQGMEKTNGYLILAYIHHAQHEKEKAKANYKLAQQHQSKALSQDTLFRFLYRRTLSVMAE